MHRPKLKDSLYGEMYWEDWEEDENYWFARIGDIPGESFELLINADSQADFLAVRGTHATYKKLIENLASIRSQMIREVLENSRRLFKKDRQRKAVGDSLEKNLRIFSVKIYQNLTAEIQFAGKNVDDTDEVFYALLDKDGNLIESGMREI